MGVRELASELERLAALAEEDANARLRAGDAAGAKRVLTAAQKELRLLKRSAADEERSVREAAQDARLKISNSGQTLGMFVGSKGRGTLARGRAADKRKLQQRQADALRPYGQLKAEIDRTILRMDQAKVTIASAQAEEVAEGGAPVEPAPALSPPPPAPSALWAPDPTGRHQLRYWDGARWTEHVADAGQAGTDPQGIEPE